jgi:hypothetical protein
MDGKKEYVKNKSLTIHYSSFFSFIRSPHSFSVPFFSFPNMEKEWGSNRDKEE